MGSGWCGRMRSMRRHGKSEVARHRRRIPSGRRQRQPAPAMRQCGGRCHMNPHAGHPHKHPPARGAPRRSPAVGHLSNLAPQGIHLMHQLALGGPSHRRVARLPRDAIQVERQQQRLAAQAGRRQRGLAAGVATTHHHHIVRLLVMVGPAVGRAGGGGSAGGGGGGSAASRSGGSGIGGRRRVAAAASTVAGAAGFSGGNLQDAKRAHDNCGRGQQRGAAPGCGGGASSALTTPARRAAERLRRFCKAVGSCWRGRTEAATGWGAAGRKALELCDGSSGTAAFMAPSIYRHSRADFYRPGYKRCRVEWALELGLPRGCGRETTQLLLCSHNVNACKRATLPSRQRRPPRPGGRPGGRPRPPAKAPQWNLAQNPGVCRHLEHLECLAVAHSSTISTAHQLAHKEAGRSQASPITILCTTTAGCRMRYKSSTYTVQCAGSPVAAPGGAAGVCHHARSRRRAGAGAGAGVAAASREVAETVEDGAGQAVIAVMVSSTL